MFADFVLAQHFADLAALTGAYGSCEGDPEYTPYADLDGDGCIGMSDLAILLGMYGTTIGDEIWALYTWDAENRLIGVEPTAADPGDLTADDKKLVFKYDYMGRRVEKRVIPWNPNLGTEGDWDVDNPDSVRRYVYHNWLPLLELEVENAGTPSETMTILRKYTWGIDLSQTLDGAGGIGGLLATYDTQGTPETADDRGYLYLYDANGNVGQVLYASDGSIEVKYEYDVFGNRINLPDPSEYDQPFRFSTKYWDDETGLGYWGYRYYGPRLGRWLSRDPIMESGGANLYGYVQNAPTFDSDSLGLWKILRVGLLKALATVENGDTVASLAKAIGLDCDDYTLWLGLTDDAQTCGTMPKSCTQTLTPGCRYTIPNLVAYVAGAPSTILGVKLKGLLHPGYEYVLQQSEALAWWYSFEGYRVRLYREPNISVVQNVLANPDLTVFIYGGHGSAPNPANNNLGGGLAIKPGNLLMRNLYRYTSQDLPKLARMTLQACYTANGEGTPWKNSWRSNVANAGLFQGHTGVFRGANIGTIRMKRYRGAPNYGW